MCILVQVPYYGKYCNGVILPNVQVVTSFVYNNKYYKGFILNIVHLHDILNIVHHMTSKKISHKLCLYFFRPELQNSTWLEENNK